MAYNREMRRDADGARASCGLTTAPESLSNDKIDSDLARCVNACKQLGFVVESAFPPALINKQVDASGDSSPAECPIYKN